MNTEYIVVVRKDNNTALLIGIAVPGDRRVEEEQEKVDKYQNLAREPNRLDTGQQGASSYFRSCTPGNSTNTQKGTRCWIMRRRR